MKIKIIEEMPVAPGVRPEVGSIHEVIKKQMRNTIYGRRLVRFIAMGKAQVGVMPWECEEIKEDAT